MQKLQNKPRIEQTVSMLVEAVNELIDSHNQKEKNEPSDYFKYDQGFSIVGTALVPVEEPKECNHNYIGLSSNSYMECTKCGKRAGEEPKEINVEELLREHAARGKRLARRKEIINTIKALQQQV